MAKQFFDEVFNASAIYDMLFFNVKAVLIHPTLKELEEKNKPMFNRWNYIAETKYNASVVDEKYAQQIYEKNAVSHPEFNKIVVITYGNLYKDNDSNEVKRYLKKISGHDEANVIEQFMEVLNVVSSDGSKSDSYPTIGGHNIISYDIPLLIKRYIANRNSISIKRLPYILKRSLNIKPWETGLMDTVNVWKFNGYDYSSLMLIADFLGLKKNIDLMTNSELSKYYWENIASKPDETLDFIGKQSATQVNLVIQLLNELRQI